MLPPAKSEPDPDETQGLDEGRSARNPSRRKTSADSPEALAEGSLYQGRYRIVRCMAAGGMGAVYEVLHLETNRRRALKVMLRSVVENAEARARFKLEATVAAEIDSEHIVETFDAGVDEATGAPFLVMELLNGEDLAVLLKRRKRLPAPEVVELLHQAALALHKTHAAGIVHRDLKPENLFITYRDDGSLRLKVLDFGIAKVVAQSGTARKNTKSLGTPVYMSPEQVRGDGAIGPASDLHSLGLIAYALLVGEPYWAEEADASDSVYPLLLRVTQGIVEPPSERALRRSGITLPGAFDAWLARAAAPRPADRFPGALPMLDALAEALGTGAPRSSNRSAAVSSKPPALPVVSRKPILLGIGALALVGGAGIAMLGGQRSSHPAAAPEPGLPLPVLTAAPPSAEPTEAAPAGASVQVTVAPGPVSMVSAGLDGSGRPQPPGSASEARAPSAPGSAATRRPPPPAPTPPKPAPSDALPPATKPGCNPGYVIDAAGHRIYKPECL